MASTAEAASIVVNVGGDGAGTCPATCTLRAAITESNGDSTADTITFGPSVTGTITVGSPLVISAAHALSIDGPGAGNLTISGGGTQQIFDITATSPSTTSLTPISISGLTLDHGSSAGAPGGAIENKPPGSNPAALTVANDVISNSTTADTNGGGAIYSTGQLTVTDSTITGNTAPNGNGGAIGLHSHNSFKYQTAISGTTISGNSANNGGAIATAGISGPAGSVDVAVTGDSHITGNHATASSGNGGGLYILGGSLAVENTTVSGNTANGLGGGIFGVTKYGCELSGSTISGNSAARAGGGIEVVGYTGYPHQIAKYNPIDVLNTTVSGNQSPQGAGIDVAADLAGTPITIESSTISGNQGGASSLGGGLAVAKYVNAPIKVLDSTISGNTATKGGGVSLGYHGTKQLFGLKDVNKGSVGFENTTIAANTATASGGGGGIYLAEYTTGGSGPMEAGAASLTSTIVSGNKAAGIANDLARGAGATTGGFHGAFSLIQTPGSTPMLSSQSDITGVDPQLGALASNGGPTQTMLPSGTSPVIDQGHAAKSVATDQIGNARTVEVPGIPDPAGGDGTDIGAVEVPANRVIIPTAGLSASVHNKLIGGSKPPLIVAGSTPVKCAVRLGTLDSCFVQIKLKNGKLLASGGTSSTGSPTSLSVALSLTSAGAAALAHSGMGLSVPATVTASTSRSGTQTVKGTVHLLARPSFTVPLQKRSSKLAKSVLADLREIAQLITGARSATCTAYSDKGKNDVSLTKAQAKAACSALKKDGFKGKLNSVGKGHAHLIASPRSSKNRRLVISFKL